MDMRRWSGNGSKYLNELLNCPRAITIQNKLNWIIQLTWIMKCGFWTCSTSSDLTYYSLLSYLTSMTMTPSLALAVESKSNNLGKVRVKWSQFQSSPIIKQLLISQQHSCRWGWQYCKIARTWNWFHIVRGQFGPRAWVWINGTAPLPPKPAAVGFTCGHIV